MVRRDEIIERLDKFNSTSVVNEQIDDLEKYIDTELQKDENIQKWANASNIGSTTNSDGLEEVNLTNLTDSVHRDINVVGDDKITMSTGGASSAVSYVEWNQDTENDIETSNGADATTTPWDDRTIAQGQFNGVLTIQCQMTKKTILKQEMLWMMQSQ
jgi:hypothetical protein